MGLVLSLSADVHRQLLVSLLTEASSCKGSSEASTGTNATRNMGWLMALTTTSRGARPAIMAALCSATHQVNVGDALARAVAEVAEVGDSMAIQALCALVRDSSMTTRAEAAAGLGRVATSGDIAVEKVLRSCLSDRSEETEDLVIAALMSISQLAPVGSLTLAAVSDCMRNAEDWASRRAAVEAIANIGEVGDVAVISMLQAGLDDENCWVRTSTIEAIAKVSWRGDEAALTAALLKLNDRAWSVRVAALGVVARLSERGDEETIGGVTACLDDDYSSVRIAALETLVELAPCGSRHLIRLASSRLADADPDVRKEAIEALVRMAETGDENTMSMLAHCMREDDDEEVRQVAETAVERL